MKEPSPAKTNEITALERRLFKKIELLMNKGQIYRDSQLNRKLLTQKIRSNATYVGYAIKKSTGKQTNQYITDYRLEAALRCIKENPYITPEEIISQCGFRSKSTFYRKFMMYFNKSPREYRDRVILKRRRKKVDHT